MALPAYASDAVTKSPRISWGIIFLCIHNAIEDRIMQATLEAIKTSTGGRWATDAKGTEKPSGAWHQEVVNRNETTPLSARTGGGYPDLQG